MTPRVGMFALFLCSSLFSSLHTASLARDGGTQGRPQPDTVAEPTGQSQPAGSSRWTTWAAGAKMDDTHPTTPSLPTSRWGLTLNPEETVTGTEDLEAATALPTDSQEPSPNSASSATWLEAFGSPKTEFLSSATNPSLLIPSSTARSRRRNEDRVTELSDWPTASRRVDVDLASETSSRAAPWPPPLTAPQDWNGTSPSPRAETWQSTTPPDLGTVQTMLATEQELWKSTDTDLRTDTGLATDATGSSHKRTEVSTTAEDHGEELRGFTEGQTQIISAVTDPNPHPNPTARGREPGAELTPTERAVEGEEGRTAPSEGDGVGLVEEEQNRPSAATTAPPPNADDARSDTDLPESSSLPGCDPEENDGLPDGVCDPGSPPGSPDDDGDLLSAVLALTPPLLVPLRSDWNAAMATWGLAWEAHVYGLGCAFALVALLSALGLLCLPLLRPPGCARVGLVHLLQLLTGASRALLLLCDPYGQRERLPAAAARLLHEAAFPCLASALGLVLPLLSARPPPSGLLRRCDGPLACLGLLHLGLALGAAALPPTPRPAPAWLALLPPAAFVALSTGYSAAYLAFYCCARAGATKRGAYRLSEASTPERRPARHRPSAEAGAWERAAGTGVLAALFLLACGGLRLYAMLRALGLAGGDARGLPPWPWWGFQLCCRVCEAGVCLSLALVVAHPLLRCRAPPPCCCCRRGPVAAEPALLPGGRRGWSLRPGEKRALGHEGMARRESESVPLYALTEQRLSEADGLDLHYPSIPPPPPPPDQAATELPGPTAAANSAAKSKVVSQRSSFASLYGGDSTADLRPPSPIDLRRSIDEALWGESLFPCSLFCSSRLSLGTRGPPDGQPCRGGSAERSLYRTSSCGDVAEPPGATLPSRRPLRGLSGPGQGWGGSGSGSLCGGEEVASASGSATALCGGGGTHGGHRGGRRQPARGGHQPACCGLSVPGQPAQGNLPRGTQGALPSQRRYHALGSASSRESLGEPAQTQTEMQMLADELAVQAEFISVCRQIDALSISSETIDL